MKGLWGIVAALAIILAVAQNARADDFKNMPPNGRFTFGLNLGLGALGLVGGGTLHGDMATRLMEIGFLDSISNQVWLEAAGGGFFGFGSEGNAGRFSLHVRWDFLKTEKLLFLATLGLSGAASSASGSPDFVFHPKVGLGMIYYFVPQFGFRADFGYEWTSVGATFRL